MAKQREKSDASGKDSDRTQILSAAGQKPLILKKARFDGSTLSRP
jgi:hypothetical protein